MGEGHWATPDSASEHVKVIVTGTVVLMPLEFGAGETVYVIVGGVSSILTLAHIGSDMFPAASTACPQKDWFAPCVATAIGGGHVLTPDPESAQVNVTVTLVLFQPAAFGAGNTEAAIVGAIVSVVNVSEITSLEFPDPSKTVS